MLELRGEPVARQQGAAKRQGREMSNAERAAARRTLKAAQDRLLPRIEAAGGRVLGQLQDAYNGVKVRIARSKIAALAALPGVVDVHGVARFEPNNTQGVPYIHGDVAWGDGLTGAGVTVAVIDTGLDYYHANFGGSGDPADFAADNGLTVGTAGVPERQGHRRAGLRRRRLRRQPPTAPPRSRTRTPTRSTATATAATSAGTAAGFGVTSAGATFAGPVRRDHARHDRLRGRARASRPRPRSSPTACSAATARPTSSTRPSTRPSSTAPTSSTCRSARPSAARPTTPRPMPPRTPSRPGIIVVASAGNEGPNAFMVGSPSTAPDVISVAALDTIPEFRMATIVGGTVNLTAINANEHPLTTPVGGPLRVLEQRRRRHLPRLRRGRLRRRRRPATSSSTLRGVCARVDRAILGEAAGAAAVIMVNNSNALPPLEGPIPRDGGIVEIPFLGVPSVRGRRACSPRTARP